MCIHFSGHKYCPGFSLFCDHVALLSCQQSRLRMRMVLNQGKALEPGRAHSVHGSACAGQRPGFVAPRPLGLRNVESGYGKGASPGLTFLARRAWGGCVLLFFDSLIPFSRYLSGAYCRHSTGRKVRCDLVWRAEPAVWGGTGEVTGKGGGKDDPGQGSA